MLLQFLPGFVDFALEGIPFDLQGLQIIAGKFQFAPQVLLVGFELLAQRKTFLELLVFLLQQGIPLLELLLGVVELLLATGQLIASLLKGAEGLCQLLT